METASKGETLFIKRSLEKNVRLDSRSFSQRRECKCDNNDLPMTDGSLYLQSGFTILTLSVVFTSGSTSEASSEKMPIDLKFVGDSSSPSASSILSFFARDWRAGNNRLFGDLYNLLGSLSLNALIEIEVIQNDGNVFDLFFTGLHNLFRKISLPNLSNLFEPIPVSLFLPITRTFSVFNNELIADPTCLEERTLEAQVHLFHLQEGNILSGFSEGPVSAALLGKLFSRVG